MSDARFQMVVSMYNYVCFASLLIPFTTSHGLISKQGSGVEGNRRGHGAGHGQEASCLGNEGAGYEGKYVAWRIESDF
jgi:hypothetical protein